MKGEQKNPDIILMKQQNSIKILKLTAKKMYDFIDRLLKYFIKKAFSNFKKTQELELKQFEEKLFQASKIMLSEDNIKINIRKNELEAVSIEIFNTRWNSAKNSLKASRNSFFSHNYTNQNIHNKDFVDEANKELEELKIQLREVRKEKLTKLRVEFNSMLIQQNIAKIKEIQAEKKKVISKGQDFVVFIADEIEKSYVTQEKALDKESIFEKDMIELLGLSELNAIP